jgi:hypothetical protein
MGDPRQQRRADRAMDKTVYKLIINRENANLRYDDDVPTFGSLGLNMDIAHSPSSLL